MSNKRRSRKTGPALSENQALHLLIGICFDSHEGRALDFPFRDEAHRRQLWNENRDRLIQKDVGPGGGLVQREPGTRPAAFWAFDAPEPRQKIENGEYWRAAPGHEEAWREYRGMDRAMVPTTENLEIDNYVVEYETEADYLRRLNLLLPGEAEALEKINGE